MHKAVELLPPSARRDRLETFVAETIPGRFKDRILAVDAAVAKTWAELDASRQKIGRPLDMSDGLIAATAIHYDLTVVTRNTKDFSHLPGLHLLNPWQ